MDYLIEDKRMTTNHREIKRGKFLVFTETVMKVDTVSWYNGKFGSQSADPFKRNSLGRSKTENSAQRLPKRLIIRKEGRKT